MGPKKSGRCMQVVVSSGLTVLYFESTVKRWVKVPDQRKPSQSSGSQPVCRRKVMCRQTFAFHFKFAKSTIIIVLFFFLLLGVPPN